VIKGQDYYLVKWVGWPTEYNLWVPGIDMDNANIVRRKKPRKRQQLSMLNASYYYSFSYKVLIRTVSVGTFARDLAYRVT
jgi:hypothetical protein